MIQQIKTLLHAVPFVPFKIRTSDGREYLVKTGDHAFVPPAASVVIVFETDDVHSTLYVPHIVAVHEKTTNSTF